MNEDLKWSNYDFTKIPFDDIVAVGQRTLLYRDLFTVSWLLGRFCNYRCSYCWPYVSYSIEDETNPLLSIFAGSAPGFNDCFTLTLRPRLLIYSSVPTVID